MFSQWGEDGLIQYLISRVPLPKHTFVEFGVENYTESNTRFLLTNCGWSGQVIDGSAENIEYITSDSIDWRFPLQANQSFVTAENIDKLVADSDLGDDLGLLSVDVDGNDYWIWKAISARPRIVIVEYNSLFGAERAVTVPYNPAFVRNQAHHSNLYYGASVAAFWRLGREKGYSLVGSNRAGNNLFFVRDDVAGALPVLAPAEAYQRAAFREARDDKGALSFLGFAARLALIGHLPVVDVEKGPSCRSRRWEWSRWSAASPSSLARAASSAGTSPATFASSATRSSRSRKARARASWSWPGWRRWRRTPDLIVHCAGGSSVGQSVREPFLDFNRNVPPMANLLEYMRRRLLPVMRQNWWCCSTAAVYGEQAVQPLAESRPAAPISPYGVHKRICEELCICHARNDRLSVAIIRLFSVYGPGLRKQLLWDACHKASTGERRFSGTGQRSFATSCTST